VRRELYSALPGLNHSQCNLRGCLEVLINDGRSDIPVLYAAREQIAGFERMVAVEEVVDHGNSILSSSHIVQMTNAWVDGVFRSQVSRGRMQEVRSHFTTIHREWAARLLDRALASDRVSGDAVRLLSPVFDFSGAAPERLLRMWSWFWYLPAAGKWTKQVLATKQADDWRILVGTAAEHGLSPLCSLAERMHLLFQTPDWGKTVADSFEYHESKITSLIASAKSTDWWPLTRLAWTIGHASPSLASRVWSAFDPSVAAALIETTHPDYFESLSTFCSSVTKENQAWATQVGRALNVDRMLKQLQEISQGDAESAFSAMSILRTLGVPIRRSSIRRIADAVGKALENCPLRSFRIGFPPFWDPTWMIFDGDLRVNLVRINKETLTRDLESGSPRECDFSAI
jgi:hypothetical protein